MNVIRTSQSHPLRIDSVSYPNSHGRIGMTLCPGKTQARGHSGARWARDLAADLDVIVDWKADFLITLTEVYELLHLKVPNLGAEARARGLSWHHLPISDGEYPAQHTFKRWQALNVKLHGCLAQGGRVLLHCMGGLGRVGTMTARLLIEAGIEPTDAIERVRAARPGAIETSIQEDWLVSFDPPRRPSGPRGVLWRP